MKIQKIEIRNFRGFPGPSVYSFELNGKNLLLYGENGSGKSSLFHAIREFFDLDHSARPFSDQRNRFSTDVGGQITITFNDNLPPASWNALTNRPLADSRVSQTALRTACLDYRAILRTSFVHTGDEVDLFDLLIHQLLHNYTVIVSGGISRTIGNFWRLLEENVPSTNTKRNVARIDALCEEFNQTITNELPKLVTEAERLLTTYFADCNLVLHLRYENAIYDRDHKKLLKGKVLLQVDFNQTLIDGHQHFLNEARLSAIAIAIYLASLKLSIPGDQPGGPKTLKLLVLDDVVIGLDLSNRLPLLDLLRSEFSEWQIILMTYDRVWFDMVRLRNPDWICEEIYCSPVLIPIHKTNRDYLQKAREHLANNDEHAAAVYTRAQFEIKLKKYCEKLHVKLDYKQPPDGPDSGLMLDGLENLLKADPKWATEADWIAHYPSMFARLRAVRKVILNPLSHSQLVTIARLEIQDAIDAVEQFTLLERK